MYIYRQGARRSGEGSHKAKHEAQELGNRGDNAGRSEVQAGFPLRQATNHGGLVQGENDMESTTDKLGDTIAFYNDDDFPKDDDTLMCTASFRTVGYGDGACDVWSVRVADAGSPTVHPVIDECTTGTTNKNFDAKCELIEWMSVFGFKPV
jgi:hypothetical protein